MNTNILLEQAKKHMNFLCTTTNGRSVGSPGNRMATGYFKNILEKNGWKTDETKLYVIDWKTEGAILRCENRNFEVFSSPYSRGCNVTGKFLPIDTIEKLQTEEITGKILFLHGKIAAEQIMPKNFVFYNPDEHKQVVSVLEKNMPKAIICATGRNGMVAGGVYPFPMFEDGDFDIPSVYMKDTEGEILLACTGKEIELISEAVRIPETAYNIAALKEGRSAEKIVVTAHIDAKIGTPGAIDNATGVTILLLLSELMKDYKGKYKIEIVAFNGEDYYAVPGQMKYLEQNTGKFNEIMLNINIDGIGYKEGLTSFSVFDLPGFISEELTSTLKDNPGLTEGLPWVQGDHSMFVQAGRPAIAVSSNWFIENFSTQDITHTPKDNLEIVDYNRLPECALAIRDLIMRISDR
ncbi:MAG TPA: M28 family metallopeptidase [Bacteroidales bacterium]|nr:M28 family metallopeptidase [Bacteroidales bacterium]